MFLEATTEVLHPGAGSQEVNHQSKEVVVEAEVPATQPTEEKTQEPELVTTTKTGTIMGHQRDTLLG